MEEKILDNITVENQEDGEIMVKIENVSKQYRLGMIGGTTLKEVLQRWWAKVRKKEDPTRKIGAKNYNKGEKFMALNGVSFEVKKGEAIGLIGHNGAGKSTLLKLLTRVTAPTDGKIYLNGRVASMLEVGTGFHGELTGRENVYMNGAILGMTKKEIDAKIEDIIDFSEVREFIDTPVKRYSSGMFVKLAFSVAAHLDAEIMLMDEVLAVGDMAFQNKCINKMKEVANSGRTIIYVSHNMNTIRALCNRCVVLNKGQVEFVGGVEEGIEVYMGKNHYNHVKYDFSDIKRSLNESRNFEMLGLTINNKEKSVYKQGEKIEFTMHCKANNNFSNAYFRFEIYSSLLNIVATSFSSVSISKNKGQEFDVNMEMDTTIFAPGVYRVVALAFEKNDEGRQAVFDRVKYAFTYEIVDTKQKGEIVWLTNFWGNIKHQGLETISIEDRK